MGDVVARADRHGRERYYIRFVGTDGRRKMRASGQATREGALEVLRQKESQVARARLGLAVVDDLFVRGHNLTVGQLIDRYLAGGSFETRALSSHLTNKRCALGRVRELLGERLATDLTAEDVVGLRNRLRARGLSASTASQTVGALSSMYRWAIQTRIVECTNPAIGARCHRADTFNGWVYFVLDEAHAAVKIGFATDVRRRLAGIATSNPWIKLLATRQGSRATEDELHKQFASLRLEPQWSGAKHRDWFRARPELLKYIAELTTKA